MSLEKKLTRLTIGIFITVIIIISIFSLAIIKSKVSETVGKSLIDIAFVVSSNPMIQKELADGSDPTHYKVQNFTERVRLKTGLLFITVMNNEGVRYSHPIPENIGRKFLGGDEKLVLTEGETYVSEGEGHLGKSVRGFTPVYKDGVQVGAVAVGVLKRDIRSEVVEFFNGLIPVFMGVLIIIIFLAKKLAKNIKSDIYGLEPEEIANELREKESIINNIEEGLIDVNNLGEITVINSKAYEILKLHSNKIIDDKIECDTLIVDPPRAGLDKHTKSVINNSNIKKVIYVSCDPMTLVRDLKDLDMYNLEKISIVDMFPQTCHVECVSILHRKRFKK